MLLTPRIRLHSIDAQETGQDFGNLDKQLAYSLALGKTVTNRPHDTDRCGRTVAEVILPDGRSMNREMVREGMAWWYQKYAPADSDPARLESEARTARRGLWGQPNPVPPRDWRRSEGVPQTDGVIGKLRSHVHHKPTCRGATTMSEKNRVTFASEPDAEKAGYRCAKDCW